MTPLIWIAIGAFIGGVVGLIIVLLVDKSMKPQALQMTAGDIVRMKNERMMEERLREEAEKRRIESDPERIAEMVENRLQEFMEGGDEN